MRIRILIVAALAALTMTVGACGGGKKGGDTTTKTGSGDGGAVAKAPLYDRLGKQDAITAVVNEFVANVVADDRIKDFFKNADGAHLKKMLVEQICFATGGPCKYTGKDMKTSHAGMGITEKNFNDLVDDLVKALDKLGVKDPEKTELLTILGGLKGDIVTK
jgi:hemoglobin